MELKETLNLPETGFPMRANLVEREPERVAHWESIGLYEKIQEKNASGELFVLHDGPPFTNGDVHIGTALNKILKDIILRYKSMNGYRTPYIPGWDCHGLPIEHKVAKLLKEEKKELSVSELRRECVHFSENFIEKQRKQFLRLGVLADWGHEYRTMNPEYEASILEVFARFVENGQIYRGKKPVYWSIPCKTALAEAEIEYKEHTSPSIYVKFRATPATELFFETNPVFFVIWTTTPWTLPANLAIAVNPKMSYVLVKVGGERYIVAEDLLKDFITKCQLENVMVEKTFFGNELEGLSTRHPFINRESPIVFADYVTADTGTGCVHTAPGHGLEDYVTGLKYGLPAYCPLDDDGCYVDDGEIPEAFIGVSVLGQGGKCEANDRVIARLNREHALLGIQSLTHQYPYCWRSKTPVIFRAMDQWFIALDEHQMRQRAQQAISEVKWVPAYGENRIRGSVSTRPDWCISRQRTWGVPLPVFFDEKGEALLDAQVIREVAKKVGREGSNYWFDHTAEEILEGITLPESFRGKKLTKSTDTLDVWIDSGSSHYAVLKKRTNLTFPADLYLEGSDQHRGWFQSSLLTSVVVNDGVAPYETVLTHGFVVGEDKKKISKSDGKPQTADDYVGKFGADVVRLWVASEDFKGDIAVSDAILSHVVGTYRTFRNTLRFQLGNLFDFDVKENAIPQSEMTSIDRWILQKLKKLIQECSMAYAAYDFHQIYQLLNRFCSVELSAVYHDILKDRLYTYAPNWKERRSSQTAIQIIFSCLVRLLAPILTFTADEAWAYFTGHQAFTDHGSIHLQDWPNTESIEDFPEMAEIEAIIEFRGRVNEKLEELRQAKIIGQSLDAKVTIRGEGPLFAILKKYAKDLPEYFIVSQVELEEGNGVEVIAEACQWERCQRSWRRVPKLVSYGEFHNISERCKAALEERFSEKK